jgi:hypothetical protein
VCGVSRPKRRPRTDDKERLKREVERLRRELAERDRQIAEQAKRILSKAAHLNRYPLRLLRLWHEALRA